VQAFVPDVGRGDELRITRGDEPLWSRKATDRRPKVGELDAKVTDDGQLALRWTAEVAGEEEAEVLAQWTSDRGRNWQALSVGLAGGEAVLDARSLPSGRINVRLLVSDGFQTAASRLANVTIPRRGPELSILGPRDGQTFATPGPMRLWAMGTDSTGEAITDEQVRWEIDGREAGEGLDLFVAAPEPGEHRATAFVKGRGGGDVSVGFLTVELGEERDEG
jgi:hypothetical protein